jgi:hypothetical protein
VDAPIADDPIEGSRAGADECERRLPLAMGKPRWYRGR